MATQYIPLKPGAAPTLGTSGDAIKAYQTQLNTTNAGKTGYTPLVVDGKYGPLTQAASQYKDPTPAPAAPKEPVPTETPKSKSGRPILYKDPNEPALLEAPSVEDLQKKKLSQAQGTLANLNKYYDSLVAESRVLGESNVRKTNAISALTGLSGSSDANTEMGKTEKANKADIDRIQNERAVKIDAVLSSIQTSAVEEAKQARLEARQSEQDRIAYREKAQAKAVENLTTLSKTASGATLEGLKKTLKPEEYAALIANAGGEAMAAAILFEGRPKDTVMGTPQVIGGKMVQAYQTPDGKVKYESIDLPEGVVPDNIQSVEKTDAGIFIINKDGTYKRVAGSAKPVDGGGGGGGAPLGYNPDGSVKLSALAQAVQNGTIALDKIPIKQRAAVAAELAQSGIQTGRQQALDSNLSAVNALLNNPGMGSITGYVQGKMRLGDIFGDQLALNQYNQVKGILSLENREKLKGSGAISDFEFKILSDAATALGRNLGDEEFKTQLEKVRDVFEGKYAQTNAGGTNGAPSTQGGTTRMTGPDGSSWDVPNDQVQVFKSNGYK